MADLILLYACDNPTPFTPVILRHCSPYTTSANTLHNENKLFINFQSIVSLLTKLKIQNLQVLQGCIYLQLIVY